MIKNKPKVNENLDSKSLIKKYEKELAKLKKELNERTENLINPHLEVL